MEKNLSILYSENFSVEGEKLLRQPGSKLKRLWQLFESVSSLVEYILWVSPGYERESTSVNVIFAALCWSLSLLGPPRLV